jgi:hypothetical protein
MSVTASCKAVLSLVGRLLPRDQRQWAAAMRAEVDVPETPQEKIAFTLSGVFGLLSLVARGVLVQLSREVRTFALVAAYGLTVGYVDTESASRWPLRLLVVLGAIVIGIARPGVAAVTGMVMGVAIVAMTRAAGSTGPYAHDPGDAWMPLVPALLLALAGAALRTIWHRRSSHRSNQVG